MPSKTIPPAPPATKPSPRTKTAVAPAEKPPKAAKATKATQPAAAGSAEPAPRATQPRPRPKAAAAPVAKPRKAETTPKAAQPEAPGTAEPEPLLELELSAGPALLEGPTREQMVRARAYELYERNGCVDGRELEDWLAAEAEVGALLTEDRTRPAA